MLLAYAITIHKSQGSGARKVYVLEAADYGLAYTAVSRAKEELVFVDYSREQLIQALHTPSPKKLNFHNWLNDWFATESVVFLYFSNIR